jgi:glutathione S-transferase
MEHVYLVILLALIEYMVFGGLVARARVRYGIAAPAITGSEPFERTFRVQQNTLEGLVIFVPALWVFGAYVNPAAAAVLGLIGIVGRAIYAKSYIEAAEKRGLGAGICGIVNVILVLGGLVGLIGKLLGYL